MANNNRTATEVSLGRTHDRCGLDAWIAYNTPKGVRYRCAICSRLSSAESRRMKEEEQPARRLFRAARNRARTAGISFNLTVEDVENVWPEDGRCPVLGTPLQQGRGMFHDGSPTLDQLDPARGYEPDNIAVLSYAANRAKGNMRAEELERLATWMRSHGLS